MDRPATVPSGYGGNGYRSTSTSTTDDLLQILTNLLTRCCYTSIPTSAGWSLAIASLAIAQPRDSQAAKGLSEAFLQNPHIQTPSQLGLPFPAEPSLSFSPPTEQAQPPASMSAAAVATAVLSLAALASLLALAVCSALLVAVVCAAQQLLLLSSASDASSVARSTFVTASMVSIDAKEATSLADDVSKDLENRATTSAHGEAKAEFEVEADSTTDEDDSDSDSDYYRELERQAVESKHQSKPYDSNEASSDLSASDMSECDEDQDEDQDEDDELEYGMSHNYDDNYHYDYHYNYDCESDGDSENEECLPVHRKLNFDDISLDDVGEEEEEEPTFVTPVTAATAVAPVPTPATDPEELRYANNPKVLADYRELVASFRAACAEHELNQRREFQLRHFVSQGRHRCDGSSVMISSNNNLEQLATTTTTTSLPAVTQRRDTRFVSLGRRREEQASKTAAAAGATTIATSAPTKSKRSTQTRVAKSTVCPRWR